MRKVELVRRVHCKNQLSHRVHRENKREKLKKLCGICGETIFLQ